ncbi:CocE/NonD family hydrolase C-terminal non-catalytic domain-containing protein [Streptomyces sp. NPDC005548]|uniref:CocE/NonD family hydrolase C-terminal non-catalytic domain-containing protein n=1 Tax=Streptomyces sp. NPDC005548 TaxID=3364724 RepID=UPI0036C22939
MARLCDVDENGVSCKVADGIVRVRAATPGEVAEHVVDLWSTSIVFRAGHRIRGQVASSNFPPLGPQPQHGRTRGERDHGPSGPAAGLPRPRPAVPHRPVGGSGPIRSTGDPHGGHGRLHLAPGDPQHYVRRAATVVGLIVTHRPHPFPPNAPATVSFAPGVEPLGARRGVASATEATQGGIRSRIIP